MTDCIEYDEIQIVYYKDGKQVWKAQRNYPTDVTSTQPKDELYESADGALDVADGWAKVGEYVKKDTEGLDND